MSCMPRPEHADLAMVLLWGGLLGAAFVVGLWLDRDARRDDRAEPDEHEGGV